MENKILKILKKLTGSNIIYENYDIDLYDNFLIDSIGFIELLLEIEKELDIQISPLEFERDEINTPKKIIEIVKDKSE